MILSESTEINTTPEKVFEWLTHFKERYTEWHPDHVTCHWVTKPSMEEGSVLYTEEYLHGQLHNMNICLTKVEPTRIEYKILFPLSVICPKGSFVIEPKGDHCIFTATLSFRFSRVLSALFEERLRALKIHMKEEGENLKRLLEAQNSSE